ncbi:MAG TPA: DUF3375 domain-containing protein [Candidatus Microbacterium stercoravium]|uniref:DUF3375 domain-containing protein n=1 Tax=Candidatus Microbacterium stercoravium TaxID=2838697 RepID=A0A9D2H5M9_9MICO|nr:DUF3375 domain-containing protein [Candidatus Microbacterium stercoravium]
MSSIPRDVARLERARDGAALGLVRSPWAAVIVAIFREVFSQEQKQVRAERLHVQVETYLAELADSGHDVPAHGDGRAVCLSWMHSQWLRRVPLEDGGEAYELTSAALSAMQMHDGLSRERALISESRLTTIVDAVHRWAVEATPDEAARVAALDAEIEALIAERDRIRSGGDVEAADDDRMHEGFSDLIDLIDQLPGDFRRVEEALDRIHEQMVRDFRADERPKGDVLGDYLAASAHLTSQTREGRAFEGALAILGDEKLLEAFREDLRAIVAHPFARSLTQEERADFVAADRVLRRGLRDVQMRQRRASQSLAEYLSSYSSGEERELTRTLRSIEQELGVWMQSARPRDAVTMDWMPTRLDIDHLRSRFYDPASAAPAARLDDVSAERPDAPRLDDVRRQGGPLLAETRDGIERALAGGAGSLAEAFNALPDDLRRPVELFGLAYLASHGRLSAERGGRVSAVRPDGTRREFDLPEMTREATDE